MFILVTWENEFIELYHAKSWLQFANYIEKYFDTANITSIEFIHSPKRLHSITGISFKDIRDWHF